MNTKSIGIVCLGLAVLLFLGVTYYNSQRRQEAVIFSPKPMLNGLWNTYKDEYIEKSTNRTLDKQQNNITTSEGQSYTMLRAVWQDDKSTFDATWKWTKENLQRPDDNLFAWLFGQKSDGTYGVLSDKGGNNSASDADSDIAMALLFAYSRWQEPQYLDEAKKIISAMWEHEVITVADTPYLAANNLEQKSESTIVINPSYFAPYAYRMFAEVDTEHPWLKLVDSSYDVLERSSIDKLDNASSGGLPPDWVFLDKKTGKLVPPTYSGLTTNYSYDAMRIPWRLALDYRWYQEPRAKKIFDRFTVLEKEWSDKNVLYPTHTHDGGATTQGESPAMYGTSIAYFAVQNESTAKDIYDKKLRTLYNPDTFSWKGTLSYYDDNWTWFGLAYYHNELPNLYAERNS
jgi:endoglucanase